MSSRTIASAFLLLCTLPCVGRADEPSLRVFYTGHSFHMFVPERVALAAKAGKVEEYKLAGRQGIGGSRVIQHWDKDKGDNLARKALEKGDVDVFTMSPHLKLPDEGIDHFVELGLKHNPKMRFLVQQSWVPFDYLAKRVKNNAERDEAKLDVDQLRADHARWRGEMEAQVKTLNKKAGRDAVFIVPAGEAVVKLRALVAEGKAPGITKQSELFTDAIGHGKLPIVILVSYCNYACITGRSPVGLRVEEPAISAELHELLQRIAWETVSTYPMSGVAAKASASATDWPQWMGPQRDDVWAETGIIEKFPEGGLKVLWRKPVSGGFAGPAVAGGKLYVTDYVKSAGDEKPAPTKRNDLQGKERVLCLDAKTGDELWKHEYDCSYAISYPAGPRCTPTVEGGKVYALGAMGDLFCLDAAKGSVIWSKNLPKTYKAPVPLWGYAGHPLVYKNLLICTAGGKDSAVVALDKETGKEVWKALNTPEIGYSPPTLIEAGGVTQLLIFHGQGISSLNPDSGSLYWFEPLPTAYSMAIMAPRKDGEFLFAGGHSGRSVGLKLDAAKPSVTKAWKGSRDTGLAPVSGTPFVENGVAYGIDGDGIFRAMRIATGERLWGTSRPVNGKDGEQGGAYEGATFVTKNAGRFFLFGENGDLVIAKLSVEKYDEVSRTKLLDPVGVGLGRKVVWSHPAYADKCVFARNDKEIVCASLAAK